MLTKLVACSLEKEAGAGRVVKSEVSRERLVVGVPGARSCECCLWMSGCLGVLFAEEVFHGAGAAVDCLVLLKLICYSGMLTSFLLIRAARVKHHLIDT